MNRQLSVAAWAVGLLSVGWVASGYLEASPLALLMTLLIAAFYLMGSLELWRFHQATQGLRAAVAALPERLDALGDWLGQVPAGLRAPVQARIEGERNSLPGPALTPYLVGLLVLLGMLGTFLGMVVTLKGAVLALESTTDVATIRAALAAPVKGLGLAFGTSVAGVAASAMLGLVSALCRRDRLQVTQALEAALAGPLRVFSLAHQREETLKSLQAQAQALPDAMAQMQAMMAQLAQQNQGLADRLLANQDGFHQHAQQSYSALAASVDRSLQQSLAESARLVGATIEPVVSATLGGLARESAALQAGLGQQVQQQLEGLSSRFAHSVDSVAGTWHSALAAQDRSSQQLASELRDTLAAFNQSFDQRATALLASVQGTHAGLQGEVQTALQALLRDTSQWHSELQAQVAQRVASQLETVAARFGSSTEGVAEAWGQALSRQQRDSEQLAASLQASARTLAEGFQQASAELAERFDQRSNELAAGLSERSQALNEQLAQRSQALVDGMAAQATAWSDGVAQQTQALTDGLAQQAATLTDTLAQRSEQVLGAVDERHARWQAELASRDEARVAQLTASVSGMASSLQRAWQQSGEHTLAQQRQICQTLAETAQAMQAQAENQARSTIAEIARLMQAAAQAPQAAAEMLGELRQQLSDSLVHDQGMLEERGRLMATLAELLQTVSLAATEQRSAIDALVGSSAELLQRLGGQFSERIESDATRLETVAAQITGSAVDVASLGEAFGAAVQQFSQASDSLGQQLQRIESSLAQSAARSDDQLAYYVAQARELIDLSLSSQKQMVDELQRVARPQAATAGEVA